MTEKISFAIENIEILEETNKSQFATLKIDVFASGNNKHGLFVSEDSLRKTAYTILEKPIVCLYSKITQDATTHDEEEVPVGFIPRDSPIDFKKLDDGRTMMSVIGKLWVKYSGKMMDVFQRDKNKSVSVEMEVLEYDKNREIGLPEILNYCYQCITILGNSVKPAIPLASADLVAFAAKEKKEFEQVLLEFYNKYSDIDFNIPKEIKSNVERGLSLSEELGAGRTSVNLAIARHLTNNNVVSVEKIKSIYKFLDSHRGIPRDGKNTDSSYIAWMLHGGNEAFEWSKNIIDAMKTVDEKSTSYFDGDVISFPYKSTKDANPALRGVDPPLNLGQMNEIAEQADSIGVDDKKNGWAIAIANFKKTHTVKDGKWVKKENPEKEEYSVEIKVEKTEGVKNAEIKFSLTSSQIVEILNNSMSEIKYGENGYRKYWAYSFDDEFVYFGDNEDSKNYRASYSIDGLAGSVDLDKKELVIQGSPLPIGNDPYVPQFFEAKAEGENKDDPEEKDEKDGEIKEKEEEDKPKSKEEKMSNDLNLDMAAMLAMLDDQTEAYSQLVEKHKMGEELDHDVIYSMAYTKMCKMADELKKTKEDRDAYMSENESLKKFKENVEVKEFSYEIESTLQEVLDIMPKDKIDEAREDSKNFSLKDIDAWKNKVKAVAFSFAKDHKPDDGIVKIAMAWVGSHKENDGYKNGWL